MSDCFVLYLLLTCMKKKTSGADKFTNNTDRADAGRTRPERPDYREIENADRRIADLEREVKQREQSREHSSLKERLEENKRIIAEREKENAHRPSHDRGMSR